MNEKESQAQTLKGQVQIFENAQFGQVRTAGTAENPLFCLTDICKALDITVQNTKKRLNEGGVYLIYTPTPGGEQQLIFVNEPNLYRVIMRSDKPQAEPFQDWVCGEVLPQIRKSGGYIAAQPDETPEMIMAKALKVADETIQRTKQRLQMIESQLEVQRETLQQLKPLADYTQEVLQSTNTNTFTQIAKDWGSQREQFHCRVFEKTYLVQTVWSIHAHVEVRRAEAVCHTHGKVFPPRWKYRNKFNHSSNRERQNGLAKHFQ